MRALTAILLLGLALAAMPAVAAQDASCRYAFDGECDESAGTGVCAEGTDTWDCRRTGAPPGPEACILSQDGKCDEPGLDSTYQCLPGTDTADCRAAGIDPDRVFFGRDDRIWPDSSIMPWSAIGRITLASGGHCTGALVGPDIVLTAAHCVFGNTEPVEFIAGASGSGFIARSAIIGEITPPRYDNEKQRSTRDVDGFDWAFLILDQPIGNEAGWLRLAPLSAAELERAVAGEWLPVMQGGYSADAKSFLSANIGCRIVKVWDDNTFYHECDTLKGDSGSPFFIEDADGYRVIGLESSSFASEPYDTNMGVDARAFWPFARKLFRR